MRSSSIARIGASAGSSASSVFQRRAAAGLSPCGEGRGAEIEQRQRVARLGLLQPLEHRDRLGRRRRRRAVRPRTCASAQSASRRGIERAERIGLGVGVDGLGVLAQHLPGVGQPQPAAAILRACPSARARQALDHAADRLLALLGRQAAIASCCSRDGLRRIGRGRVAARQAGGLGDARASRRAAWAGRARRAGSSPPAPASA